MTLGRRTEWMLMNKILTLFVLLYTTLFSADLIITDGFKESKHFSIKYYYDQNSLLNIDDIEQIVFKENVPSQFTMGYKYDNVWFKIEIENHSKNENFVLYFTESIWSTLDLYSKINKKWKVTQNGLDIPLYQ
jgi:two-component system, sensor histidine kinase LadS